MIKAQRFAMNGAALGPEVTVNTFAGNVQVRSEIAALPDGGFVVVWAATNASNAATDEYDIYVQRFDQNGVKDGTETKVNTYTAGWQTDAFIAALQNGGFVVAWESENQDGSGLGVYAQPFDKDGAPLGSEVQVSTTTLGDQHSPTIAASGDGYLILWTTPDGVYGRTFDVLNAPPIAPAAASVGTLEDTPSTSVAIGASDPEGDPLTYSLKPGSLPQKGSVTFQNDSFTYTPKDDANGPGSFTILISDAGGLSVEQTVSVSIAPVNDAPTGLSLSSTKIKELSAVGATVAPLSATDVDGDPLTYELVDNADGRFSLYGYTLLVRYGVGLDYEQQKTHTVKVKATDPGGLSTETSFVIEVVNVAQETTKGSAVADLIVGGGGRDQLAGGRQNDTIFGGGSLDILRGGSGNDRLDGGLGRDTLYGNTGKDAFLFTTKLGGLERRHAAGFSEERRDLAGERDLQGDRVWLAQDAEGDAGGCVPARGCGAGCGRPDPVRSGERVGVLRPGRHRDGGGCAVCGGGDPEGAHRPRLPGDLSDPGRILGQSESADPRTSPCVAPDPPWTASPTLSPHPEERSQSASRRRNSARAGDELRRPSRPL